VVRARWRACERNEGNILVTDLPFRSGVFQGVRTIDESSSKSNVLPGLHVRFTPDKRWVIRGSWTNTIGRPITPTSRRRVSFSFAPDTPEGTFSLAASAKATPT
jgi:hypothetical protein